MLIAPPAHPLLKTRRLTIEKLAAQPFVMPWPQANARRVVEGQFAAKGLQYRVILEAGGWEVVKRYVALGVGIAIVPACCLTPADRRELGGRSVRTLFGQDVYGILVRKNHVLPRAAEELVRIIESGGTIPA
jgi:DNA-binding transcriptional LysR family regulator